MSKQVSCSCTTDLYGSVHETCSQQFAIPIVATGGHRHTASSRGGRPHHSLLQDVVCIPHTHCAIIGACYCCVPVCWVPAASCAAGDVALRVLHVTDIHVTTHTLTQEAAITIIKPWLGTTCQQKTCRCRLFDQCQSMIYAPVPGVSDRWPDSAGCR